MGLDCGDMECVGRFVLHAGVFDVRVFGEKEFGDGAGEIRRGRCSVGVLKCRSVGGAQTLICFNNFRLRILFRNNKHAREGGEGAMIGFT